MPFPPAADELHMWYSQLHAPLNEHQVKRVRECQTIISKRLGIEQRLQLLSEEEDIPPAVEGKE
jgi:hypothetical protein